MLSNTRLTDRFTQGHRLPPHTHTLCDHTIHTLTTSTPHAAAQRRADAAGGHTVLSNQAGDRAGAGASAGGGRSVWVGEHQGQRGAASPPTRYVTMHTTPLTTSTTCRGWAGSEAGPTLQPPRDVGRPGAGPGAGRSRCCGCWSGSASSMTLRVRPWFVEDGFTLSMRAGRLGSRPRS